MRFFLLIAVVLSLSALVPAPATAGDAADAMAQAMARMMEAMGLFDGDGDAPASSMPSMMPGMSPFGGQMPWGQMPGYESFADPITAFGMRGMTDAFTANGGWPWASSGNRLDGIWEGRDGGLMILRQPRFRLHAAQGGHIEGLFQHRGERIAFYEPTTESVRAYELAEQQGRLVMRDAAGNTYLYRRLWLEAPSWDWPQGGSGH
ncbi:hypothetical protein [Halochromatium salexigens]|uniref:Uncharacterized protein n=1 Tax=Halochromatium salexigens TaxID=49447 RepID=A0AAJ0XG09_HALSE|nr:hypothetical protein [Halochromatium salexigens]MBK5930943.1 hypothetical protein [Halochromatium salexigens]